MITACTFHTPIAPSYFRNNRSTRQKSLRCFPMCSSRGHVNGGFCGQSIRTTMVLTPGPPQATTTAVGTPEDTTAANNTAKEIKASTVTDNPSYPAPESKTEENNQDPTAALDINDFIIILEIRPLLTPRISSQKFVKKAEILNTLRTKHEKSSLEKELFMGEIDVLTATATTNNGNTSSTPANGMAAFTVSSSSFFANNLHNVLDPTSSSSSGISEMKLYVTFNSNHSSWDYSWKSNRWLGPNEYHVVDIIVLKYHSPTEFQVYSNFVSSPFIVVSSHKKSGNNPNNLPLSLPGSTDIADNDNLNNSHSIDDDHPADQKKDDENNNKDRKSHGMVMLPALSVSNEDVTVGVNHPNNEGTTAATTNEPGSKKPAKKTPVSRKRSASALSNSNNNNTSKAPHDPGTASASYGEDMNEVMEGAQLLSNLFGTVITLPSKQPSDDIAEEHEETEERSTAMVVEASNDPSSQTPAPTASMTITMSGKSAASSATAASSSSSSSSNNNSHLFSDNVLDRHLPLPPSSLTSSALAVALPRPAHLPSFKPMSDMPAYPGKKVAIVRDRQAKPYEVHYPDLASIEEVRGGGNTNGQGGSGGGGKRRRTRRNHPQIPLGGIIGVVGGGGSSSRDGDSEGDNDNMNPSGGKGRSSSSHYRNHRQLPDKDPNQLPHDISIEDSANQLLMLASKDQVLDSLSTIHATSSDVGGESMYYYDGSSNRRNKASPGQVGTKKRGRKKQNVEQQQPPTLTVSSTLTSDPRYLIPSYEESSDDDEGDEDGDDSRQQSSDSAHHNSSWTSFAGDRNATTAANPYQQLYLPNDRYQRGSNVTNSTYTNVEDQVQLPAASRGVEGEGKSTTPRERNGNGNGNVNGNTKPANSDAELLLLPRRVTLA